MKRGGRTKSMMELAGQLGILAVHVQQHQEPVVSPRALRHAVSRGRAVRALHVELLRERRSRRWALLCSLAESDRRLER